MRPCPREKCAQLACLHFGDSQLQIATRAPFSVADTLDDWQGLSGERQDMSAAIIGIRHALNETGRLQSVEETYERNWPDSENLSKESLLDRFVLRQVDEDSASHPSHAWESRAQLSVVASTRQPSCLVQQPHNRSRIIRAGRLDGLRCWPRGRGLVQQIADGHFIQVAAPISTGRRLPPFRKYSFSYGCTVPVDFRSARARASRSHHSGGVRSVQRT
jgi:hypothetical protein